MRGLSQTDRRARGSLRKGSRRYLEFRCAHRGSMVTFTSWNDWKEDETWAGFRKESLQFSGQFAVIAKINEHVIQQARFAKFRGDQHVGLAVDVRYRLEGLGIHNFRVIDFGSGFFCEDTVDGGLQRMSIPGTVLQKLLCGLQGAMQHCGRLPLSGIQIDVPRRHGQSIGLSLNGADYNLTVEI